MDWAGEVNLVTRLERWWSLSGHQHLTLSLFLLSFYTYRCTRDNIVSSISFRCLSSVVLVVVIFVACLRWLANHLSMEHSSSRAELCLFVRPSVRPFVRPSVGPID